MKTLLLSAALILAASGCSRQSHSLSPISPSYTAPRLFRMSFVLGVEGAPFTDESLTRLCKAVDVVCGVDSNFTITSISTNPDGKKTLFTVVCK